jgi:hypothetical protein
MLTGLLITPSATVDEITGKPVSLLDIFRGENHV